MDKFLAEKKNLEVKNSPIIWSQNPERGRQEKIAEPEEEPSRNGTRKRPNPRAKVNARETKKRKVQQTAVVEKRPPEIIVLDLTD